VLVKLPFLWLFDRQILIILDRLVGRRIKLRKMSFCKILAIGRGSNGSAIQKMANITMISKL
jgi:hypothetical protein